MLQQYQRKFVHRKPFQLSLMFADKAGAYQSVPPFRSLTLE